VEIRKEMKNKYYINSDRYNHEHRFVRILDSDYYRFIPEENWMPLYITYTNNKNEVAFVDTEGGPCIDVGWSNGIIKVEEIILNNDLLMFKLSEVNN
jgi:hypothetical protein